MTAGFNKSSRSRKISGGGKSAGLCRAGRRRDRRRSRLERVGLGLGPSSALASAVGLGSWLASRPRSPWLASPSRRSSRRQAPRRQAWRSPPLISAVFPAFARLLAEEPRRVGITAAEIRDGAIAGGGSIAMDEPCGQAGVVSADVVRFGAPGRDPAAAA